MELPRSTKSMMAPDDLVTRSIRARRRFKALVRLVIANLLWLEDVEDEQLSRNVKKNVQLLTKRKGKKGLLTLEQKAILCKPAEYRTQEERQLLYRIIGGLKCFRKYPEDVKLQLAGVTYFVYYGPNRTIVKQDQEAHALYFIIQGEVNVAISQIDPVIKEEIIINVGTMVAGSMFGEVSLLHNIPRTATISTTAPCELLCLKKADFDIVLKDSVKKQWNQIQKAMFRFSYFDGWDEVAVRECCIYSKIKPYVRDQTIIGDGEGISTSAYFVLKGKCKLIEHLLVKVTYDSTGKKKYEMYRPEDLIYEKETMQDVCRRTVLDERKTSATSITLRRKSSIYRKLSVSSASLGSRSRTNADRERKSMERFEAERTAKYLGPSYQARKLNPAAAATSATNRPVTEKPSILEKVTSAPVVDVETFLDTVKPVNPASKDLPINESANDLPQNVETHFMQVCIFSETACFGLGENMRRRRIVAMTDYVECLLIPRYWLFQRNIGNLWSRIQQYLDTQIPSTAKVFQEFVSQRKWLRYRSHLAKEIFGKPPVTAMYNVPYSIRINEDIDFE